MRFCEFIQLGCRVSVNCASGFAVIVCGAMVTHFAAFGVLLPMCVLYSQTLTICQSLKNSLHRCFVHALAKLFFGIVPLASFAAFDPARSTIDCCGVGVGVSVLHSVFALLCCCLCMYYSVSLHACMCVCH